MIEQHNSLGEKFLKKGFWLYLFSFIIAPIGYIIKIIISHDLNVDEIGIIYGVMSLMVLLSSFNDLGMTESLNKFLPEYITKKEYSKAKSIIFYSLILQGISLFFIFLFFFFGADFIGNNYFKDSSSIDVIKSFAFYFLAINFFQIFTTFFISIQNTFLQKFIEFFRMFLVLGLTFLLFFYDFGNIYTYSLTWVISVYLGIILAFNIFYFKYYKKYLKNEKIIFEKKFFINILKYALLVFLANQAGTILSQMDMQMVIYFLGNHDAGYYTNYLSIIGIPFVVIGPIMGLLFPVFSELIAKNEHKKIILIKEVFQKSFLGFIIALSILFFVFSQNISTILFGEKFLQSGLILKYSILFIGFNFLLQLNFNILASIGQVRERLNIILIAIVFNFFANIILIKYIGVSGAALATGLGWILIWFLSELNLKDFKSKFDYKYYLKNIFVFILIGIFIKIYILEIFANIDLRINQFFTLSIISLLYFSVFIIINKNDFKYFFGEIKKVRNKN
ncbi:MAG: oligosaccharide flippase family protein [Candidatus Gracilibacteria bacterium]|nr:oligosaccharide flippase family protein [Candidatus Gracilibacteria bacterium]